MIALLLRIHRRRCLVADCRAACYQLVALSEDVDIKGVGGLFARLATNDREALREFRESLK